jgi:hypothetical protein
MKFGIDYLRFNILLQNESRGGRDHMVVGFTWQSILLVEETGVPGKTNDLPQDTDKLYQIILYRVHLSWPGF